MIRKTKIICTIGPATDDKKVLRKMMQSGMNVARFNFSHGEYDEHERRFKDVAEARKEVGLPIATLLDTKGPEIRLGKFENPEGVLTGGELPALIVADSISRMLPGVLSDDECFEDESHFNSLLEYPQYTHPAEWNGRKVPEVLLSGHHQNVDVWRRQQSIKRTFERRPDMFEKAELSKKDKLYLSELKANEK